VSAVDPNNYWLMFVVEPRLEDVKVFFSGNITLVVQEI